jgi:hypothetical protein
MNDAVRITVEGIDYDAFQILALKRSLEEQLNYRQKDAVDALKLFNVSQQQPLAVDGKTLHRLARLAGATLLEGLYILKSLELTKAVSGDWCEYGVAHGRTSALIAEQLMSGPSSRSFWLYDSFQGLPKPHEKDVLLHDIFNKGTMAAYEGEICMPERYVREELESVSSNFDRFNIMKGWITPELLVQHSPDAIAFAFLDMDFYQSTKDVLQFLIGRMPPGGRAVVDDYGVFSEGVLTAVQEIMAEFPGAFTLEHPHQDKFVILTRTSAS